MTRQLPRFLTVGLAGGILIPLAAQCMGFAPTARLSGSAEAGETSHELRGGTLTESELFGIPYDLAVVDRYLVVTDVASDATLHIIRRADGRRMSSLGRRGRGPGEFVGAWSIDPSLESDRAFWVFDLSLRRLTHLDLELADPLADERLITFHGPATLTGPVWIDSATVASLGFHTRGRLELYGKDGKLEATIGEFEDGDSDVALYARQYASQATLVAHPSRTMLAAVPRYASDVEIFRLTPAIETVIAPGPVHVSPDLGPTLEAGGTGFVMAKDGRFGYIDGSASADFIFALFSGRRVEEDAANFGQFVHVFDWQGRVRTILELESDAIAIATDVTATTLYVLRHEPRPAIDAYRLGEALGPLVNSPATSVVDDR